MSGGGGAGHDGVVHDGAGHDEPLDALLARAAAWADDDVDPDDAAAVRALVARARGGPGRGGPTDRTAAVEDLRARFAGPLAFGTAGLRGALGAGEHRMNRAVVVRAAAGLAAHLLAVRDAAGAGAGTGGPGAPAGSTAPPPPSVVVGHDARHGSAVFARDTAAVMTAAGLRATLLPRALPTPVLAFAVRHLGADAGVMVTASHNPAADNGYKVYLGGADGGSQIVAPTDAAIAARIAAVGPASGVPRADGGWEVAGEDLVRAYAAAAARAAVTATGDDAAPRGRLRVVLTALHGVGGALTADVLARAGITDVTSVPEQAEPDPGFPTVAFPNPEEDGALDLALDLARARGADLVLAVDPDADRCALALPDACAPGGWRTLTGDQVGAVLGEQVAAAARAQGRHGVLAASVVSSRLLGRIAAAHGLTWRRTLTGFKWISRAPDLVFGYEEAIGYCLDPVSVRDKDGISAAAALAVVASRLAAHGGDLGDVLDAVEVEHGVHATAQLSVRVADPALIEDAMARLRQDPPRTLAGEQVVRTLDLADGLVDEHGDLPPTDALLLLARGAQVVVRPSGTEPKLKAYLEAVVPLGSADAGAETRAALAAARARAADRLDVLRADVSAALGI